MEILKRIKKDLINYKVDINDSNLYSPYFFNILELETTFGYGKNLILLNPNYNILDGEFDILVELLDYKKNPIYHTISSKTLSDKSRIITAYITEDVFSGPSTLTLVGKTKDSKFVKYSHNIIIDKKNITNSDIYFISNKPTIEYSEIKKRKYELDYTGGRENQLSGNGNLIRKTSKSILVDSYGSFNTKMIGNDITLKLNSSTLDNNVPFTYQKEYTYRVHDIIDGKHLILSSNLKLENTKSLSEYEPDVVYNIEYTSSYINYGTGSNIPNIKSYLYINLNNLKNDSGYIDSIGVFSKSNNSKHETYNLINKSSIKSKDLLVDSSNIDIDYRIGKILNQNHIDTYISVDNNNVDPTYNSADLDESVETIYNSNITTEYNMSIGSNNPISIYKNHRYTVKFTYYYKQDSSFKSTPKMDVIVGGDPIGTSGENLVLGTVINTTDNNRGTVVYDFVSSIDANIYPVFKIYGGKWYISNISISSFNSYGFNPEHTYCYMELPSEIKDDDVEFLIEFYNQNNKKSKYYYQINRMLVDGSNIYVSGRDNIINGSLYVGTDTNNGIQIEQHNNAAIIRSYNFNPDINSGFMLYSGSNPITESVHTFGNMGLYMKTDGGKYIDFSNNSLDIDADSIKINGSPVGSGGGSGDTWETFAYISDGVNTSIATNGTESIFTISGSNGVSASLSDTTMSIKLEPIYDYVGSFETETTGDIAFPIRIEQSGSISGFVRDINLNTNTGRYSVVGVDLDGLYQTATQTNGRYGIGLSLTSNTGVQKVLTSGYIYIGDYSFPAGQQLFISGSNGRLNSRNNIIYSDGDWVQCMGYSLTTNLMYFNPGYSFQTHSIIP